MATKNLDSVFELIRGQVSTRLILDEVLVRLGEVERAQPVCPEKKRKKRGKYKKKKTWSRWEPDELEKLIALSKGGESPSKIAKRLRRPYGSIYGRLERMNLPINRQQ